MLGKYYSLDECYDQNKVYDRLDELFNDAKIDGFLPRRVSFSSNPLLICSSYDLSSSIVAFCDVGRFFKGVMRFLLENPF